MRTLVTCSLFFCLAAACTDAGAPPDSTADDPLGESEGAFRPWTGDGPLRRHRCHEEADCKDGFTCEKQSCGAEVGYCVERPHVCPDVWIPECGCDGVTYSNACDRRAAGVDLLHPGECTRRCDGIAGIPCKEGEVCLHPPGTCDIVDGQGVCVDRPEACPEVYAPVCGCDGETYSNRCFAISAGVSIDHKGRCEKECDSNEDCGEHDFCSTAPRSCGAHGKCEPRPEFCPDNVAPVCGCDGKTYFNLCEANSHGVSVEHEGQCTVVCDGIAGLPCEEHQFCDHGAGECNVSDAAGECVDVSEGCPRVWMPVCGCDGKTYGNDCERIHARVQKDHDGACNADCKSTADCPDADHQVCKQDGCGSPGTCVERPVACSKELAPVCGCDGVTYDNECIALQNGTVASHSGECFCGGHGHPCAEGEFCDWKPGECDIADNIGHCVDVPGGCPDVWMPVCGCDGQTYSNDCDRIVAGVQKDHDGACEPTECHENGECKDSEWCARATCDSGGTCQPRPQACPENYDPVCGCDGKTYSNKCFAAAHGTPVAHEGACSEVCGGIAGVPCHEGQFCDPYPGECDISDGQGECVPQSDFCPAIYDPVCGCDGKTYSSDCVRIGAGVGKDHDGRCECEPVACDLYCRYGYQTGDDGCEICKCNPEPPTCCDPTQEPDCHDVTCCGDGKWHCPATTAGEGTDLIPQPIDGVCGDLGRGEICAGCCEAGDKPQCFEGATCCADGKWACNDEQARPTCEVVGEACGCPGVMCDLYCPWGFQTGPDGCEICACNPPICPEVLCAHECPNGYVLDENGCNTCECKPPDDCGPVCDIACRYGHKVDEHGCELCACNPEPSCCDAGGEPSCGDADATCCDDGKWQCANAAGSADHVCIASGETCTHECPGVMCSLWCEYGFEVGPDGCEVCNCKEPPASTCCREADAPPCEHGASCCGDGKWACTRLDGTSACEHKGEVCHATDATP